MHSLNSSEPSLLPLLLQYWVVSRCRSEHWKSPGQVGFCIAQSEVFIGSVSDFSSSYSQALWRHTVEIQGRRTGCPFCSILWHRYVASCSRRLWDMCHPKIAISVSKQLNQIPLGVRANQLIGDALLMIRATDRMLFVAELSCISELRITAEFVGTHAMLINLDQ